VRSFTKKIAETHIIYESSQPEGKWNEFDLVVFFGVVPEYFDTLKGSKKVFFVFFGQPKLYREAHLWTKENLKKVTIKADRRVKITKGHSFPALIFFTFPGFLP